MESEGNATVSSSKEIVDINYDCLEGMFEHLNIFELINEAEANMHLKVAAEIVFVRKVKKRLVVIEIGSSSEFQEISIHDDAIYIRRSRLGFCVISLFGRSISGIFVS